MGPHVRADRVVVRRAVVDGVRAAEVVRLELVDDGRRRARAPRSRARSTRSTATGANRSSSRRRKYASVRMPAAGATRPGLALRARTPPTISTTAGEPVQDAPRSHAARMDHAEHRDRERHRQHPGGDERVSRRSVDEAPAHGVPARVASPRHAKTPGRSLSDQSKNRLCESRSSQIMPSAQSTARTSVNLRKAATSSRLTTLAIISEHRDVRDQQRQLLERRVELERPIEVEPASKITLRNATTTNPATARVDPGQPQTGARRARRAAMRAPRCRR